MASDLYVQLEPYEQVRQFGFQHTSGKHINFSVSDLNNFLPRTHQSNRNHLPRCYCLSVARLANRPGMAGIVPEFGRSKSNGTSVIKEINLKNWPSCPAFRGHQDRRNRCLSIHHDFLSKRSIATIGLSRTVSEINGDFSRKVQIFLPPVYAPLKGFPLELDIGVPGRKLRWWDYGAEKEV